MRRQDAPDTVGEAPTPRDAGLSTPLRKKKRSSGRDDGGIRVEMTGDKKGATVGAPPPVQ